VCEPGQVRISACEPGRFRTFSSGRVASKHRHTTSCRRVEEELLPSFDTKVARLSGVVVDAIARPPVHVAGLVAADPAGSRRTSPISRYAARPTSGRRKDHRKPGKTDRTADYAARDSKTGSMTRSHKHSSQKRTSVKVSTTAHSRTDQNRFRAAGIHSAGPQVLQLANPGRRLDGTSVGGPPPRRYRGHDLRAARTRTHGPRSGCSRQQSSQRKTPGCTTPGSTSRAWTHAVPQRGEHIPGPSAPRLPGVVLDGLPVSG